VVQFIRQNKQWGQKKTLQKKGVSSDTFLRSDFMLFLDYMNVPELKDHVRNAVKPGAEPRWGDWGDRPP